MRRLLVAFLVLFSSGAASAQDQAQRNLREQAQQQQNWYWHQMEQDAAAQQQLPARPPRPSGEWIETCGRWQMGVMAKAVSRSEHLPSSKQRPKLFFSASEAGGECTPTFSYQNQCIALTPSTGSSSSSIRRASKLATAECHKNGGKPCEIVYSACTEPYFQRYNY